MPVFDIKAPDGTHYEVTGPEGSTEQQALQQVMAQHQAPAGPQPGIIDRIAASPPVRFLHDAIAAPVQGIVQALAQPEGAAPFALPYDGPRADVAGAMDAPYQGALGRNRNTPGYAAARSQADQVQARRGSGVGDQLATTLLPALAGAAGLPGGFDAMNANADAQAGAQDAFAAQHPVIAGGARVAGGFMASPAGVASRLPTFAGDAPMLTRAAQGNVTGPLPMKPQGVSALRPGAQQAVDAGYTLPPRMITTKPGPVADALAGWSGKVKTAQAASSKNQEVTNALASQSLGLPTDTILTDNIFRDVRKQAGQAYKAIPEALPMLSVDKEFADNISTLGGANTAAASEFPDIMRNSDVEKLVSGLSGKTQFPTSAGMELVKKLRKDASTNFKAAGDASKLELAHAQRNAADELDSLIERNLSATGDEALVKNYRDARQLIAKSHDLEVATNTATGNVSARKIAQLANRGRPLSGGMKTIGDAANAFPKALQSESAFGEVEPLSILDIGASAMSLAHGNPGVAGAFLGRPLARSALLSRPMQQRLVSSAANMPAAPLQLPRLSSNALPYGLALSLPQSMPSR